MTSCGAKIPPKYPENTVKPKHVALRLVGDVSIIMSFSAPQAATMQNRPPSDKAVTKVGVDKPYGFRSSRNTTTIIKTVPPNIKSINVFRRPNLFVKSIDAGDPKKSNMPI